MLLDERPASKVLHDSQPAAEGEPRIAQAVTFPTMTDAGTTPIPELK